MIISEPKYSTRFATQVCCPLSEIKISSGLIPKIASSMFVELLRLIFISAMRLPFLAKKSRRGIRAYLEPDIQWYHQKRNALEVLEAFQLLQEEASSPFSLFIVWMFSFHMPSLKTNPND